MNKQEKKMTVHPNVGDAITYRLRLAENPRDPLKLWHGVVDWVAQDWYRVRLTDKGYEGLRELVIGFQIVDRVIAESGDKLSSIHFGEMRGC
jgi:hypothetical protein